MSRHEPMLFLPYDAPTDAADMRRGNRNLILRSIITRGPATRAELARRTGMSRPTVSVIANDLLASGVLTEGERVSSGGAPGTLLELASETGVTLVADISCPNTLTLATVTVTGDVASRSVVPVADTADAARHVEEFATRIDRSSLIGVALAVRGFVDISGVWRTNDNPAIDVELVGILRRSLRLPVFAVNNVDAVSVADLRDSPEGLAAQASLVGPDMGLGLILEGRLLNGRRRRAGHTSHVAPGFTGPTCPVCGRTCLSALVRAVATADSTEARERAALGIAVVTAPIIAAVELDEVVLSLLPPATAQELCTRTTAHLRELLPDELMPAVRLSARGEDVVLFGAAAMMLYSRLS